MTKDTVIKVLDRIRKFKERTGTRIVDSHVHPLDVMGAVHHTETAHSYQNIDCLKPGLLEFFNYGKIEKIGSRIYFKLFPDSVVRMIKDTYREVNENRIINEMHTSLVDQSVLLALDPWAPTESVGNVYARNKNFLILGSLDVHSVKIEDIETTIKIFIDKYRIIGLKFHPNLQGFRPQPSHNQPSLADKLRKIYETAAKYNLYMLFHGGISNYTKKINRKYPLIKRNRSNALLINFCNEDGRSELLGTYGVPIVIAHAGHYGMVDINYRLLKTIADKYKDVFFDTSGVSTATIRGVLKVMPSTRVIFGSDALYNRIAYNLAFLYRAVMESSSNEAKEAMLKNILGGNFYNRILKY